MTSLPSNKIRSLFMLLLFSLFLSVTSIFVAFFEGPQAAHCVNCVSILSMLIIIGLLVKNFYKNGNEFLNNKVRLFMLIIIGLVLNAFISLALIVNVYGFKQYWSYKNFLEIEYKDSKDFIK